RISSSLTVRPGELEPDLNHVDDRFRITAAAPRRLKPHPGNDFPHRVRQQRIRRINDLESRHDRNPLGVDAKAHANLSLYISNVRRHPRGGQVANQARALWRIGLIVTKARAARRDWNG